MAGGEETVSLRLVLAVTLAYVFGALSVTADEIFWLKLDQGTESVYYFPIIGPWKIWAAWDLVFAGMGVTFVLFCAVLAPWGRIGIPHLPRLRWRTVETLTIPTQKAMTGGEVPVANAAPSSRESNEALTGRLPPAAEKKLVEVPGTGIYERSA